jgi:hypothetical protein
VINSIARAQPSPFISGYEADNLPQSPLTSPQWNKVLDSDPTGPGTSESVSNGILTVFTASKTDYLEYRIDGGPGSSWSPTGVGSTLEVRLKTDFNTSSADWAGNLVFSTGSRGWNLGIGANFISDFSGGGDFPIVTNDSFHTYRFTIKDEVNGPLAMYVDGSSTPAKFWPGAASATNRLGFGDVTSSNEGGQIQCDYLRWTNKGRFAPATTVKSGQAGFGAQWLRERPLTIMGEVGGVTPSGTFNASKYLAMNMNTVFVSGNTYLAEAAARAGIDWHMQYNIQPSQTLSENDKNQINYLISRGHATAWYLPDEPSQADFPNLASFARWMNAAHPEVMVYANVFDTSSSYLNNLLTTVKPDLLMFDNYPFKANGSNDSNGWFSSLMGVRQASLAHHIPYGGWLQAYVASGNRTPSESDTRYNGYTLLTAGYTMLNYYTYDDGPSSGARSTFIDQNGNPTAMYSYAALANHEYATLGKTLRFLSSTEVRFVPGQHTVIGGTAKNSTPSGLSDWTAGAGGDSHITSVSVAGGQVGSEKNGLLGLFYDDNGQTYFMLTNLNHGANLSASATSLNFVLTFDNSINNILRLDRVTGAQQVLNLTNHQLSWTLPGGTGDLFKYDVGDFIGHGWCMDASGDWSSDSNWGGGIPNAVGATAIFGDVIRSARTVYSDAAATVGTLRFDSANCYQLSGNGSLTIAVTSGSGSISVLSGAHKINLPLIFASNANIAVASGATLTIGNPTTINAGKTVTSNGNVLIQAPLSIQAGGTLVIGSGAASLFGAPSLDTGASIDVKTNAISIDYSGQADPSETIRSQLASGFNGGAWNGAGINTSSSIANQTGVGWKDSPASKSITVKYTYYGDADLDGAVSSVDFNALVSGYGKTSGANWADGDFDYDGKVTTKDFNYLAGNFGATPIAGAELGSVVPEPALGLALMGLWLLCPSRAKLRSRGLK